MQNEIYTEAMKDKGRADAADFQQRSADMSGTEMYAEGEKIPDFQAAKAVKNMLERPVGFVCKSTAGRVVKLLQVYNSDIYPQEPEELPAQWGFAWSTDPKKAREFVAISTSPYNAGECCTAAGHVWRCKQANVVWSPETNPEFWTDLGTIEDVMSDDWTDTEQPEPDEPSTEPEEPEQGGEDEPETYPEFVQPTGAHNAYNTGDRVTYNGKVYESTMDGNVYSPDAYPQGWKLIE